MGNMITLYWNEPQTHRKLSRYFHAANRIEIKSIAMEETGSWFIIISLSFQRRFLMERNQTHDSENGHSYTQEMAS